MNGAIIINFFTSFVVFAIGVLFIANLIKVPSHLDNLRIIFGIIFMGYGIYRFLNVLSKLKMQKLKRKSEEMKKAREKLLEK